jgi:hypothetical protein
VNFRKLKAHLHGGRGQLLGWTQKCLLH